MNDTTTENSEPGKPLGFPLNDQLCQAPERARLPNRWRVVCVAGAEPYFERHPQGSWAQRERADEEIAAAVAAEREQWEYALRAALAGMRGLEELMHRA